MLRAYFSPLLLALCLCTSLNAHAAITTVLPDNPQVQVNSVNIYYLADVTMARITELSSSVQRANLLYPKAKRINVLINSRGGDTDAGFIAYKNLQNSKIPVHAINLSHISSAGSMIYCAGEKRSSLAEGKFLLHPADFDYGKSAMKPNEWEYGKLAVEGYNQLLRNVYGECTNLSEDEINQITSAEYHAAYLDSEQAKEIQLSQHTITQIPAAEVFVYINN